MESEISVNLLDLTNGVTENLADVEIEVGTYDLIRLYISEASVTLVDGSTFDLNVPSGAQTGIKVFVSPGIEVATELSAELLLDMNVQNSFIAKGPPAAPTGFQFKPVIRAANMTTAGRLGGMVTNENTEGITQAEVWVEKSDTVFASTIADSAGNYALIGLPEGEYNAYATSSSYDTVGVNDIMITGGNELSQDFVLTSQ